MLLPRKLMTPNNGRDCSRALTPPPETAAIKTLLWSLLIIGKRHRLKMFF